MYRIYDHRSNKLVMEFGSDAIGSFINFYGQRYYWTTLAITGGVTITTVDGITAPTGSRLRTSNATGVNSEFVAKDGKWEFIADAETSFTPAAAVDSLVDNTGGVGSVASTLVAQAITVTGVDGTGSNAASKADVDAQLVAIRNNLATLALKINQELTALRTANLQIT